MATGQLDEIVADTTAVPEPEPQQADASPVLDLVQQHASEWAKAALARRRNAHDEASAAIRRSQALLDRIAALVPQQPVQARDDLKRPLWQHDCAAITAFADPPKNGIDCTWCTQIDGRWRPLLVGGDPAPEQSESVCHRCHGPNIPWSAPSPLWNAVMRGGSIGGTDEFDGIVCPTCFAVLAQQRDVAELWRFSAERVHAVLATTSPDGRVWNAERWLWVERDELPWPEFVSQQAVLGGARDDLNRVAAELAEARRQRNAAMDKIRELQAAQPDPLVLSLPEADRIAQAIGDPGSIVGRKLGPSWGVGEDGYAEREETVVRWGARAVLALLAPPREPRTWPALKPGPDPVDLPQYVTVEGWGSYGLREDGLYANTDGYPDDVWRGHCLTFAALRALGDVTEVTE